MLGATSIEKNLKNFSFWSGRNFLDPLPPSSKKGPTDENVGISYLIVIIKFGFFEISSPPPFHHKSRTSPIFTIEVAPKHGDKMILNCSILFPFKKHLNGDLVLTYLLPLIPQI